MDTVRTAKNGSNGLSFIIVRETVYIYTSEKLNKKVKRKKLDENAKGRVRVRGKVKVRVRGRVAGSKLKRPFHFRGYVIRSY